MVGMAARFIEANTCEDACGILKTDEHVEGAPVYRCPGCDSRWIELDERTPDGQPARRSVVDKLLHRH